MKPLTYTHQIYRLKNRMSPSLRVSLLTLCTIVVVGCLLPLNWAVPASAEKSEPPAATATLGDPQELETFVDRVIDVQMEELHIAGAVVVIVKDGEVIALGHNRNLLDHDPTAHAEIVTLRQAGVRLGNHRLTGCEIFVTIEPCAMCAGALVHARLARLVYGASDPKAGSVSSVMQVINHPSLNHQMEVVAGVLEEECAEILRAFFQARRG